MTAIDPFSELLPETEENWFAGTGPWQRLFILAGLGLLVVGVLVPVALPELAGPASMLATIGVLGGLVGVALAVRERQGTLQTRKPPAVEERSAVSVAGADFEGALQMAIGRTTGRAIRAESTIRSRLRSLAVAVLARARGLGRSAAADQIDAGDWPDPETGSIFETGSERRGWLGSLRTRDRSLEGRVRTLVDHLESMVEPSGSESDAALTMPERPLAGEWQVGRYRTGRWGGILGLGLLALMAGAVTRTAGPTLVAAVLVGLAGYARLLEPPAIQVRVERTLDPPDPDPGQRASVTVTVANEGPRPLLDLRVIDAVPEGLTVLTGSPRHATALAPGESDSFEYAVPAVAGEHTFSAAYVEARDPSGERARTTTVDTPVDTLSCDPRPPGDSVPLHPQATGLTGRVPTEKGGTGVEFHSVREYRRGDPLRRVDWNRLARTGELATRQLREEHAATVVLLVDVRAEAAVAPAPGELSAVERARFGAARLADTLLGDGDRVGLATIEPDTRWVAPGGGSIHRDRLAAGLKSDGSATDPLIDFAPAQYVRHLRRRLPAASQLLCLSPLLDEDVVEVFRHLHAHGHQVSVLSPDPTNEGTLGGRVTRLERSTRAATLREAGIRVIDWDHGDDLSVALERARRGWRS